MTDVAEYIKMAIGLLAIVDPLGALPVFLAATAGQSLTQQRRTARIAALTAALTLLAAMLVGEWVLIAFGISLPAFRVSGGILFLMMAMSLLYARSSRASHSPEEDREAIDRESVAVVPLGIPLLAGPGGIAMVIVHAHRHNGALHRPVLAVCIVAVIALTWLVLEMAPLLARWLGRTGIKIVTRLMGLLLAAIAIEFIARGAIQLFPGWGAGG